MNRTIFALGFFDGVHIGHRALLSACHTLAQRENCDAGVITFTEHPDSLVTGCAPKLINSISDRVRLLRNHFFMDTVIALPFDNQMRSMPWKDFLQMLSRRYNAAGFVCGADFRFGYHGEGTAEVLKNYCKAENLPCEVVPDQEVDGIRVSSTRIRQKLEDGDMDTAVRLMGHPHLMSGKSSIHPNTGYSIVHVQLPNSVVIPKPGIYKSTCIIDGVHYPAVTEVIRCADGQGQYADAESCVLFDFGNTVGQEIVLELYQLICLDRDRACPESLQNWSDCYVVKANDLQS